MVNYANSKVYKIEPICEHDEGDVYVGSTTKQYLSQRMDTHRKAFNYYKKTDKKYTTVYSIFEKYGIENCHILLLENAPCESKDQLNAREGFYMRSIQCVNKVILGRTKNERYIDTIDKKREYSKMYYIKNAEILKKQQNEYYVENSEKRKEYSKNYVADNKDKVKEKLKIYRTNNKEKLNAISKKYYEENKESLKLNNNQYYKDNADKIKEKNSVKYACECGGKYIYCHKSKHCKTKMHQNYLSNQTEPTTP